MIETACLGITFNEGADQERIQEAVEQFYSQNKDVVAGAWYYQFIDELSLERVHGEVKRIGYEKPKNNQKTLE